MGLASLPRFFAAALTVGAFLWVTALLGAAATRGTSTASAVVYDLSSVVCHQRPERSFSLNGSQLPVCARCFALYAAGALAAAGAWLSRRPTSRRSRELLLLAALPTAVTIPVEWLGLSALSTTIRAAAAVPLGAAAGWTFVRALRSEAQEVSYDPVRHGQQSDPPRPSGSH